MEESNREEAQEVEGGATAAEAEADAEEAEAQEEVEVPESAPQEVGGLVE